MEETNFIFSANQSDGNYHPFIKLNTTFEAGKNQKWVPYKIKGDEEEFPDKLMRLFKGSPTHQSIIKAKISQSFGKGLIWDASEAEMKGVSEEMIAFINNFDGLGRDINEVAYDLIQDEVIFGSHSLIVSWGKGTGTIVKAEHSDISKLRATPVTPQTEIIEGYYYGWDWTNSRTPKTLIPIFEITSAAERKKAWKQAIEMGNNEEIQKLFTTPDTQILYRVSRIPGEWPYYGHPDYEAGIIAIESEIALDEYGLKQLKGGFKMNHILHLFNIPQNERKSVANKLKEHHVNTDDDTPLFDFVNMQDPKKMEVTEIGNDKATKLITSINENLRQKILTAHGVTDPIIVGIKTPGQLGNTNELEISLNLWLEKVIIPIQHKITKTLNMIMEINNLPNVSFEMIDMDRILNVAENNSEPIK